MRFASLGSGSEGNGLVVEVGTTRVLIDCGFGVRDTVTRLARLGLAPAELSAILVTHEHADHMGGVAAFAGRYDIPVCANAATTSPCGSRSARWTPSATS
jgi:phosphoribosyl 1,2-cyclic phosphodiesterase